MSEMDDIFDLDHYMKKAPKEYRKAWKDHIKYHMECEVDRDSYREIVGIARKLRLLVKWAMKV